MGHWKIHSIAYKSFKRTWYTNTNFSLDLIWKDLYANNFSGIYLYENFNKRPTNQTLGPIWIFTGKSNRIWLELQAIIKSKSDISLPIEW